MGGALTVYAKFRQVHNKITIPDIADAAAKRVFTKLQLQRLNLAYRYQLPRVAIAGGAAVTVYSLYWFALHMIPLYHNDLIRQSYADRARRHELYAEEKPEYLEALLHGYETLRPRKDE